MGLFEPNVFLLKSSAKFKQCDNLHKALPRWISTVGFHNIFASWNCENCTEFHIPLSSDNDSPEF